MKKISFLSMPRFKQRFSLVCPPVDNHFAILDTLKVSDSVLFLTSAVAGKEYGAETIDNWGTNMLQECFGQVCIYTYIILFF